MRFFIPEQVVSWLQKRWSEKLATAEYKNDVAPARNTEGGGF
jgi:hypothetical protein